MNIFSNFKQVIEAASSDKNFVLVVNGARRVFSLQVVGALLSYAAMIAAARYMGTEQYGVYAFLLSFTALSAMIAGFGLPFSAVRYVAEYLELNDENRLTGFVSFAVIVTLWSGVILSLIIGSAILIADAQPGNATLWALLLALVVIPLIALQRLLSETARAFHLAFAYEGPIRILRPLSILLVVGVLVLCHQSMTSVDAMIALLIAVAIGLIVQVWYLRSRISFNFKNTIGKDQKKRWLNVSVPFLVPRAFNIIIVELDIVMIGLYLGPDETAVYQIAARLSLLTGLIFSSSVSFAAPKISALYASGQMDDLARLLKRLTHLIFWPTLVAGIGLIVVSPYILSMVGAGFEDGWSVLVILVSAAILQCSVGPVVVLLNMTGHQNICAIVFGGCIALNVVLHVVLIPPFGMLGAAFAVALTYAVSRVALYWFARNRLGLNPALFAQNKSN